jgi:hypothetical protein
LRRLYKRGKVTKQNHRKSEKTKKIYKCFVLFFAGQGGEAWQLIEPIDGFVTNKKQTKVWFLTVFVSFVLASWSDRHDFACGASYRDHQTTSAAAAAANQPKQRENTTALWKPGNNTHLLVLFCFVLFSCFFWLFLV